MKALTIMSVVALTISGLTLLAGATTGSAESIFAARPVISDSVGEILGIGFVWVSN